jgi:hypothetical protein
MYTKDRHTYMMSSYYKKKDIEHKENAMKRAVQSVDTYGNGTTGYMIKHGSNAGKILKHLKVDPSNF